MGVLHLPSSVLQRPSSNIRNNTGVYFRSLTWVYYIRHQVYCRGHHLTSETTLGCTSGASLGCYICHQVVCIFLSCKSGASHGVLYMPTGVLNMQSCTSEASLGCTSLAIKCTARLSSNIMNNTEVYFRSLTWVYCICHQVYCRGHHLTSGTTLGCTSGASLGCTAFAIKCTAEAII